MAKDKDSGVKKMEKQVSFSSEVGREVAGNNTKEKPGNTRNGCSRLMEKQMERQFTMGETERKKSRDSPGKRGDTQIHLAARAGNLSKIKDILGSCEDGEASKQLLCMQNMEGETPLYVAAENGHASVVGEMLKYIDLISASTGATNGYDPFHIAARNGHVGVLKELLYVFPNLAMTTGPANATALLSAANQGHIEVVNLLLETGVDLAKIAKNNGKTVLHSTARMGHVEVVKTILEKDPSIGFRTDKKGQTALHMAVKGHSAEMVLELLKSDSSLMHMEDSKGNSALHIAAKKGRIQIVDCLIATEGININSINKEGDTPLDLAEKFGPSEMSTVMRDSGALNSKELQISPTANPEKQLKKTVSDIRHDVESQLQQSRKTGSKVKKIAKGLKKLHINGLNNAINSATVVAVLIATVAFAAIFQVPGQYMEKKIPDGKKSLGQANIANQIPFLIFFVFDSLSLFISLAVVVVQTSVVVIEQKAKKQLMFVINKLMWVACLCISVAFTALTYVVVGTKGRWLAVWATVIGAVIMLTTIGSMCYCVVRNRIADSRTRQIRKSASGSKSFSVVSGAGAVGSDPEEISDIEYNKMMYVI